MTVRPAKTQISLGIRPVWSESSLCAQWITKNPSFLHADSEVSNQTGRMPRLIWVVAGRTCHFVGFIMGRLIFCLSWFLYLKLCKTCKKYKNILKKHISYLFTVFLYLAQDDLVIHILCKNLNKIKFIPNTKNTYCFSMKAPVFPRSLP